MAFCSVCGTKLDGQAVCPGCGTPAGQTIMVNGNTSVIQGAPKSERSMAIAKIDDVLGHFSAVEDDFNRFIAKSEEIEKRKKKPILKWMFVAPLVWIVMFATYNDVNYISEFLAYIYGYGLLIAPLVLPIVAKVKNAQAIKRLDKETDELVEIVLANYKTYEGEMPVGFEYYNPKYLNEIRGMLTSGRATNIPAAINLVLDDQHKQIMELRALLTQNAAEAAAAFSAEASVSAASAAESASRAEFNTWMNRY